MHCEIANDIATLRAGLLHSMAFESNIREVCHIKKLRAAQVIVPLFEPRIDAVHLNPSRDGRALRMLTIEIDVAREPSELACRRSKELMRPESDHGTRCVKLIRFVSGRTVNQCCKDRKPAKSNCQFHWNLHFICRVSPFDVTAFKSGVRDNGNLPNKLPSAKAGSLRKAFASCTPAMRASSISKCAM